MDPAGGAAASCYGGGDIVGAVFGTLICGIILAFLIWWLYRKYWTNRKGTHLVQSNDPEHGKDDYAFDNPAFKNEATGVKTSTSPLDTKWMHKQNGGDNKKKSMDDSSASSQPPRLVSLRGSDFTGLGIELCGGLKEGIFVKKVMPQGPAAGIVNTGDRITSITIDFRHIVQEDAMTILSYASPYNVQLELVDGGKGNVIAMTPSPKSGHPSLTHPLYRSSSQADLNTIERDAKKKLFPNEDTATAQSSAQVKPSSPGNKPVATVYKENEKKNSFTSQVKGLIEEKLHTRSSYQHPEPYSKSSLDEVDHDPKKEPSSPSSPTDEGKKGLKFGIRVLPPNVSEKIFGGKSPNKVQADNENNTNLEKNIQQDDKTESKSKSSSPSPPIVQKRKDKKSEEAFTRQDSLTSSGIKRDASGIPQEVPEHMMQAALSAKEHRKSSGGLIDSKKSKGKAPRPPPVETDLDISTETIDTTLDINSPRPFSHQKSPREKMNFTDNFTEDVLNKSDDSITAFERSIDRPSNSSTPKSERKKSPSDTESQIAAQEDHESDMEESNDSNIQIELNSKQITVHQVSEEENSDEGRRTASLGDLSKLEATKVSSGNRSNTGTLERAQSLDITDGSIPLASVKATSKKRKAPISDTDLCEKEPRLMELEIAGMDTLQRGRLKSAYEWGNLEDAIYDKDKSRHDDDDVDGKSSDTESLEHINNKTNKHEMSLVKEVMAVADRFDAGKKDVADIETIEIVEVIRSPAHVPPMKTMEQLLKEKLEEAKAALEDDDSGIVFVKSVTTTTKKNPDITIKDSGHVSTISTTTTTVTSQKHDEPHIEKIIRNGHMDGHHNDHLNNGVSISSNTQFSPISFKFKTSADDKSDDTSLTSIENVTDQVKIINYGTNMPDDVKVSRYPFGSLERPKSDVLKKLLAQKMALDEPVSVEIIRDDKPILFESSMSSDAQPISLTLIGGTESDMTESSQISPVYSSDNMGVNSISISSMEVNIGPTNESTTTTTATTTTTRIDPNSDRDSIPILSGKLGMENVVTITTDSSQPSSIITIDDDKLDFTLQMPPDLATPSLTSIEKHQQQQQQLLQPSVTKINSNLINDEVFIVDSLSQSKKFDLSSTAVDPQMDDKDSMKTFVTEIHVQQPHDNDKINAEHHESNETVTVHRLPEMTTIAANIAKDFIQQEKQHTQDNYPRNAEIKFTTSTYESSSHRPHFNEKRLSQIEQIRSNFEKNNVVNSEIPVPVRKSSIPTLKMSPSKIPVFNSSSKTTVTNDSQQQHSGQRSPPNSNNNVPNKVSVSVTSIKNSARHPSVQ